MSVGPRNISTNPRYRNAVARARNRALQRLALERPVRYQQLLTEERVKEDLAYIRKPALRTGPIVSRLCKDAIHELCNGRGEHSNPCCCSCHD